MVVGDKVKVVRFIEEEVDYSHYIGEIGTLNSYYKGEEYPWEVKFEDMEILCFSEKELSMVGKTNPNSDIIIKE